MFSAAGMSLLRAFTGLPRSPSCYDYCIGSFGPTPLSVAPVGKPQSLPSSMIHMILMCICLISFRLTVFSCELWTVFCQFLCTFWKKLKICDDISFMRGCWNDFENINVVVMTDTIMYMKNSDQNGNDLCCPPQCFHCFFEHGARQW